MSIFKLEPDSSSSSSSSSSEQEEVKKTHRSVESSGSQQWTKKSIARKIFNVDKSKASLGTNADGQKSEYEVSKSLDVKSLSPKGPNMILGGLEKPAPSSFFVMPDNWKPGDPIRIPDPQNPGEFIELPQSAIETISEQQPVIGASLDVSTALQESLGHYFKKKKKKKKKKKIVEQNLIQEMREQENQTPTPKFQESARQVQQVTEPDIKDEYGDVKTPELKQVELKPQLQSKPQAEEPQRKIIRKQPVVEEPKPEEPPEPEKKPEKIPSPPVQEEIAAIDHIEYNSDAVIKKLSSPYEEDLNLLEIQNRQIVKVQSASNIKNPEKDANFEPKLSERTADVNETNEDKVPKRRFRIQKLMNEAINPDDFGNYDFQKKQKVDEIFEQSEKDKTPDEPKFKIPQPEKDPFALEDPKIVKKQEKILQKQQNLENELEYDEKALKMVAIEEIHDKKYKRLEYLLNFVRFIGSFIVIIDICLKIQYYTKQRFVDKPLRQIYLSFLFIRPVANICVVLYNLVTSLIQLFKVNKKHMKQIEKIPPEIHEGGEKDEVPKSANSQRDANDLQLDQPISQHDLTSQQSQLNLIQNQYQSNLKLDDDLEDKLHLKEMQLEYQSKGTKIKCLIIDLLFQHIFLSIITITGFIRIFASQQNFYFICLISLICEFVTQSAPLMIIQIYNNNTTDYSATPLVNLNIAFSILNIIDLVFEFLLSQIVNPDTEFQLFSKSKIDESNDEIVTEEDESQNEVKKEAKEVLVQEKPFTIKELHSYNNEIEEFLRKMKESNGQILGAAVLSAIISSVFISQSNKIFKMAPCGPNKFEKDLMCFDCLGDLPNCSSCSSEYVCDTCQDEFYIDQFIDTSVRQIEKTGCLKCQEKHGPLSMLCEKEKSIKCGGTVTSLVDGVCIDCLQYPNSNKCNGEGATSCESFYYLEEKECKSCSGTGLSNCLECSGSKTCTKCNGSFFSLIDGICSCKGGVNTLYDPETDQCGCEPNYFLTTTGCITCSQAIPNCSSCKSSTSETPILLADHILEHNGNYLTCDTCPYGFYLDTGLCKSCSSKFNGCQDCDATRCKKCQGGYLQNGDGTSMTCQACGNFMQYCIDCESEKVCNGCEDGYLVALFKQKCNKKLFG